MFNNIVNTIYNLIRLLFKVSLTKFSYFNQTHLCSKLIVWILFEIGLRQERPAHLHPESIYQAMRERGRAIPATPTVPIVERKTSPSNPPPRIVDGRVSYDFDLQLIFHR